MKETVTLQLDEDIVAWLRGRYRSKRIHKILREAMYQDLAAARLALPSGPLGLDSEVLEQSRGGEH